MNKEVTPLAAFGDFLEWIKQPVQAGRWSEITREQKQYIGKAVIDARAGRLGTARIKTILTRHAPERYEFQITVKIKNLNWKMTIQEVKEHLSNCMRRVSRDRFNLENIQIRVVNDLDGSEIVTVSVYDPKTDTDLILFVDFNHSHLIKIDGDI